MDRTVRRWPTTRLASKRTIRLESQLLESELQPLHEASGDIPQKMEASFGTRIESLPISEQRHVP